MKTILCAVDFSDLTPAVVQVAMEIAKAMGAHLQLFHAIEPAPSAAAYGYIMSEVGPLGDLQDETRRRATLLMDQLLAEVRRKIPETISHLAFGSPLEQLLACVRRNAADLVVVGSHGHGAVSSFLLGSVADRIVRHPIVPTLIVPAPSRDLSSAAS